MELTEDPELELVREAILLGRRWRAYIDEKLKPTGLTLARSTVLYWLSQLPDVVTQRELADLVGIEGPTLVRQLHALEAQGLVERVSVPTDRRAKGLKLTAKAQPLLDALRGVTGEASNEHLSRLDPRKVASATKLLRGVREKLGD